MANLISKIDRYTVITDTVINQLFQALEKLRAKHKNFITPNSAFTTTIAHDGDTIYHNTTNDHISYPQQIKKDLEILETSKYISSAYSSQVTIPNLGTLITAAEYYNSLVDIINPIDSICVHNSDNSNRSDNSVNPPCSDHGNYGNRGNNSNRVDHMDRINA